MKQLIVCVFTLLALTSANASFAQNANAETLTVIESWFNAMKNKQLDQAASFLAKEFMSIHTDGIVRNKTEELALIKNLDMKSFKLTDYKFSQSGDVMTVTYKDQGAEKIDNKQIATAPAGRMAVLQKQAGKWLIVAYANLDSIGKK